MMQNIFSYLYSYLYNKVITPISKHINVNNSICILFYRAVTPCVIGVFRHTVACTVKYSNYVALKICYIIVLFAVKFKAYRCISVIAEVPFVIISVCLCCQLVAVSVIIELYIPYCLACAQSVYIC